MMTTPRKERRDAPRDGRATEGRCGTLAITSRASMSRNDVDAIRSRINDGGYDTPQAIDATAHRILDSGDL